ncbi:MULTISPECIES: DUF4134 family protein [Pedobacter]|uniref:Uncharacterized protein n=1 Tax=Pedobacter suwonensis TaxID=332999 RepID=A0A1I0TVN0_9SPHI|nr:MULTISPECIES: DUF4134 family protein [Pedobacter]SFA54996.1 protein of unknown function [Pedobacter suwonensis]
MRYIVFLTVVVCILILTRAMAQPGIAEMGEARSFIRESFFSMSDLSYVLAALISIIGAVHVYHKMQMGKDVSADIPAWFFSALFIIVINIVLVHVFGL